MKQKRIVLFISMFVCLLFLGKSVSAHTCNTNEWKVLKLANKERLKLGKEPYTSTDLLQKACDTRANELSTLYSHYRPDGTSCFSIFSQLNIKYYLAGENIAIGSPTPSAVMASWMDSPGHKANIIGDFSHMGVGYKATNGVNYGHNWVQLFVGGCMTESISVSDTKDLMIAKGKSIESLNLTVTKTCNHHGKSYMPLINEITSGYNADKLGKQTVTVTCNDFKTSFSVTVYDPTNKKLSSAKFSTIKEQTYTGKAIKPSIKITYGTSTLKAGTDYTLSYKNNTKSGTATVTVKGKGKYTGTVTKKFKITQRSIAKLSFSKVTKKAYTGKAIKPNVTVKYGKTKLVKNKDYTISYQNNKKKGTAKIIIKGKGNYKGTKTISFKIYKK